MTVYLDASSILGAMLLDSPPLPEIRSAERRVTSELAVVECHRVLDRMRLERKIASAEIASRHAELQEVIRQIDLIEISPPILARASEPMPEPVGSLDAIHLATALMWRDDHPGEFVMATHDHLLARAARAYRIKVVGVPAG